ncbi:SsrA-binding protein [Elusimicrobium simillimum]|uniref:SsrA-binding protein SmpB n=1 Tax=Elusimicrobium simillimum TaxID=3143438 RepID=UPI003C703F9D
MAKKDTGVLVAATNRKAYHNYHILDTYEAGLELLGSEVKSIRQKEIGLDGAFVRVEGGQAYVYNMHINPYKYNTVTEVEPLRPRRLLLNKKEINKLQGHAEIKGHTIIPLEVYFKNGWAKIKVGLGKGKQLFDKRETIKKRDLNREMEQSFKNRIKF